MNCLKASLFLRNCKHLTSIPQLTPRTFAKHTPIVQKRYKTLSQTPSHACCTVPPVVKDGYKPKGDYTTVNGLKTYATGPSGAKKGILVVYDIFGFFPQTLQGADILAHSDSQQSYRVYIPDLFEGKPADISWYPPDNDEKGKKLGEFFSTTAAPPKHVERIPKIIDELKKETGIETWGVLGYCWGGKVVNLTTAKGTPFKAGAAVHPAMVDAKDACAITVPVALLPSKDESKDDVAAWEKAITVKTRVEWFNDQVHGFMAARGDLENERVRSEYERGYKILLDWFHDHL